tara:strand:+ start:312 stop:1604 length:1293 start_codon:yes stop_codon:yes gene_type:complete
MLEKLFKLSQNGTNVRTEILAGVATFLTMAYILVMNPNILAAWSDTGMDFDAVFVATIIASVVACLIMGLWANWPIALAPGMGLNAFFAFVVVGAMGYSFQEALAAVFIAGIVFIILSVTPARQWIINSIPKSMKFGIGAGIGLFLAIIGLKNGGVIVADDATLVTMGNLGSWAVLMVGLGFAIMAILDKLNIPGSIIIGILAVSIISWVTGQSEIVGIVGAIPEPIHAFSMDFGRLFEAGFIGVAFAFLFVDFFDTAGTLTSVANLTGKVDSDGKVDGIGKAVLSDSVATTVGALVGTSNTTSYIESGAGVKQGGRTGLTAVTVAVLFLLCLFFAPLAKSIPVYATAPALIFVATFFLKNLRDIDWDDVSEYAPAALAAVLIPLTFNIAHGIAIGFIAYVVIKALSGRSSDLNAASGVIAILSVAYFVV